MHEVIDQRLTHALDSTDMVTQVPPFYAVDCVNSTVWSIRARTPLAVAALYKARNRTGDD